MAYIAKKTIWDGLFLPIYESGERRKLYSSMVWDGAPGERETAFGELETKSKRKRKHLHVFCGTLNSML